MASERLFPRNHSRSKPWYERAGGSRFQTDQALVADLCPRLRFRIDRDHTRVSLEGPLVLIAECGLTTEILTRITFPWDYPQTEPTAFDAEQRFKPWPGKLLVDRHIISDGQCCLWLPPRSPWNPKDPLALRRWLEELIVFFDRQLTYDVVGVWPGPQYDHGAQGYLEFIREQLGDDAVFMDVLGPVITMDVSIGRNDPCACGLGKKYKQCHLRVVEEIQRQIGMDRIMYVFHRCNGTDLKR